MLVTSGSEVLSPGLSDLLITLHYKLANPHFLAGKEEEPIRTNPEDRRAHIVKEGGAGMLAIAAVISRQKARNRYREP